MYWFTTVLFFKIYIILHDTQKRKSNINFNSKMNEKLFLKIFQNNNALQKIIKFGCLGIRNY